MRYKKIVLSIIASVLCLGLLNGCGHENEISIKIETYLQEEYGEEFEVLSWNQPKQSTLAIILNTIFLNRISATSM